MCLAQTWVDSKLLTSNNNISIDYIKPDSYGNYIAIGTFEGEYSDLDTNINANSIDIFLAKYDYNFNKIWFKIIGGDNYDFNPTFVLDNNNNIYILGSFLQTCKFTANDSLIADFIDVFFAKYNSDGEYIWSKHLASNSDRQYAQSIDIDKNGDVIGSFRYKNSATIIDTTVIGRTGVYNNVLFKSGSDGTIKSVKNIISSSTSLFTSIKAFSDGYYIDGQFRDTLILDNDPIISSNSTKDIFLLKTDFNFNDQWIRRSYGNGNDFTGTITQDNYGNVYFTGFFNSDTLKYDASDSGVSSSYLLNKDNTDIFIIKINKSGNLIWLKNFEGKGFDWARSIRQEKDYLFLTGYFSDTLIYTQDTLTSSDISDSDVFMGYLDLEGNVLKLEDLETTGLLDDDSGTDIIINDNNSIIISGFFKSENIEIGESVYTNSNNGFKESFLARYNPPLSSAFTQKNNPTCNGSTDGELVVTPYFGVSPYTYAWSHDDGLNDSTATGLTDGTYSVTVTDALDSTAIAHHTLTEPDSFIFNPSVTHVNTCSYSAEGEIDINVTGGNGGNSYYWFESEGGSGVELTDEDQIGLTPGTYSVTVTDEEGCAADTTIYISGPEPITFGGSVVTSSSSLALGAIDLVYQGGTGTVTFSWEGPSGFTDTNEDISDLNPGSYSVTATDNSGCAFDTTFHVLDETEFYAYVSEQKDACQGTDNGKATVSFFLQDNNHTDITYLWNAAAGNQTTAEATGLGAGTYSVTVTDNEADPVVENIVSVTINELAYTFDGEISAISTSALDCYGDSDGFIDVNITSAGELPYSYSWNTGATTQDLTNVGIGTYSITVTDANECVFTIPDYVITQPTEIQATAEVVSNPTCHGDYDGELTVSRSGGTEPYSYLWNDPGSQTMQNADGLDAGFYTVTVTDANGCHKSSSVNLTEPPAIQVDKTVYHVSCHGGSNGAVQLAVSGGTPAFSYFWTTDDGSGLVPTQKDQSGLTPGTYSFTATDAHNCMYEDSVEITEPETSLTVEITDINDALCHGVDDGNIDISASGGTPPYIYAWATDDGFGLVTDAEDQSAVGAGTYQLTVIDDNGCEATLSATVNEPEAITIVSEDVVDATSETATDGSITIEASGGTGTLSYTLTPGDEVNVTGVFENLSPDDYTIEITDDNSCGPVTTNLTVSFPDAINSLSLAENITLYPNPTSANITVEIDAQQAETYTIEILNITGQRIFKDIIPTNGKLKKELNLSNYAKGIYFIKISTEGFYYQEKVIFQ